MSRPDIYANFYNKSLPLAAFTLHVIVLHVFNFLWYIVDLAVVPLVGFVL